MPGSVLRAIILAFACAQMCALARVMLDYVTHRRPQRMERHQAERYASLALMTFAIGAGQIVHLHDRITWLTWLFLAALIFGTLGTWANRYSNGPPAKPTEVEETQP